MATTATSCPGRRPRAFGAAGSRPRGPAPGPQSALGAARRPRPETAGPLALRRPLVGCSSMPHARRTFIYLKKIFVEHPPTEVLARGPPRPGGRPRAPGGRQERTRDPGSASPTPSPLRHTIDGDVRFCIFCCWSSVAVCHASINPRKQSVAPAPPPQKRLSLPAPGPGRKRDPPCPGPPFSLSSPGGLRSSPTMTRRRRRP